MMIVNMAENSGQYEWVVSFRKLRNPCKPAPQAVQPYGGLIIMMMMILIIIMADLNDDQHTTYDDVYDDHERNEEAG